jgi:hypothetical protein
MMEHQSDSQSFVSLSWDSGLSGTDPKSMMEHQSEHAKWWEMG